MFDTSNEMHGRTVFATCKLCQEETFTSHPFFYYRHLHQKHFHDYFKVLLLMSKDDNLPLCTNHTTKQNTEETLHAYMYAGIKYNVYEGGCITIISNKNMSHQKCRNALCNLEQHMVQSCLFDIPVHWRELKK